MQSNNINTMAQVTNRVYEGATTGPHFPKRWSMGQIYPPRPFNLASQKKWEQEITFSLYWDNWENFLIMTKN